MFIKLAIKSLLNRKGSVLLALLAMSVSTFCLFGVEHIKNQTKQSFASTVSGTDLIVGARTGQLNLLLYSVFRIGSATNNVSWSTYKDITSDPNIKWAVPISLGDSHKGYPVIGTTVEYFEHYQYGKKHKLSFSQGSAFNSKYHVVLGAHIAAKLGYTLGDKLLLSHGLAESSFAIHKGKPFEVVGVLNATGTPVDQSLHISLEGLDAVHEGWGGNQSNQHTSKHTHEHHAHGDDHSHHNVLDEVHGGDEHGYEPKSITAFFVKLKSRLATFKVQKDINEYRPEAMTSILPGVALSELWQSMRLIESALKIVSILVFFSSLLGLSAMMLNTIRERSHEIYLLRVIGAPNWYIFCLIELEAVMISLLAILIGGLGLTAALIIASEFLSSTLGVVLSTSIISYETAFISTLIVGLTILLSAIPALSAYVKARNLK